MGTNCCRCGRLNNKGSAVMVYEKDVNHESVGGVCDLCFDEVYFGGWWMDQDTDQKKEEFLARRKKLFGD